MRNENLAVFNLYLHFSVKNFDGCVLVQVEFVHKFSVDVHVGFARVGFERKNYRKHHEHQNGDKQNDVTFFEKSVENIVFFFFCRLFFAHNLPKISLFLFQRYT